MQKQLSYWFKELQQAQARIKELEENSIPELQQRLETIAEKKNLT
ncbi:MAG TPA: hypothetical protein VI521_00455 [Candidatus Babeliales bacterium]|nr:hypothetical protein [Candidatus Babeliales bacterium]